MAPAPSPSPCLKPEARLGSGSQGEVKPEEVKPKMAIYTDEELAELAKEEEEYYDEYEDSDEDIDYDEFDEYYDDDDK